MSRSCGCSEGVEDADEDVERESWLLQLELAALASADQLHVLQQVALSACSLALCLDRPVRNTLCRAALLGVRCRCCG